jgi:TonB family protein
MLNAHPRFVRWLLISLGLHGLALAGFQWLPDSEPARIRLDSGQSAPVIALQTGFVASPPAPKPPAAPPIPQSPAVITGEGAAPPVEETPEALPPPESPDTPPPSEVPLHEPERFPVPKPDPEPEQEFEPKPEEAPAIEVPAPPAAPTETPIVPNVPTPDRLRTSEDPAAFVEPTTVGDPSERAASVLRAPLPPYPRAALRAGLTDVVTLLEVEIDERGKVRAARILLSCGREDMDRSALNTVRRVWRFQPAERLGRPVSSRETIEILWQIR